MSSYMNWNSPAKCGYFFKWEDLSRNPYSNRFFQLIFTASYEISQFISSLLFSSILYNNFIKLQVE